MRGSNPTTGAADRATARILGLDYSLKAPTTADAHSRLERSQYTKLAYVVDILTACGFEAAFATNEVQAKDLASNMSQICINLKTRTSRTNNWTFKSKLAFINTVLSAVLGAKIKSLGTNKNKMRFGLKHYSSVGSDKNSPLMPSLCKNMSTPS